MEEKPVYKFFIGKDEGIYYVNIFQYDKGLTIGRGKHSNRQVAIKLAKKNLENNLNLVEKVLENEDE